MSALMISVGIGALLGAGLGYFGQCSSGTCPLTSTWWRGAMYGGALGAVFGLGVGGSSGLSALTGKTDSTNLLHVAEADFDRQVLQSAAPVLVDFYAPWCGPCKTLAPTIAKLADDFAGRVKVAKVNVDEASELSERYRIQGVPTLILFQGGKIVDSVVGLAPEETLRQKLDRVAPVRSASSAKTL
jgi:thioredoxin 1